MDQSNDPISSSLPNIGPSLKKALAALYTSLAEEQRHLGVPCHMCGKCCNFKKYDHELWVTNIELAYLIEKEEIRKVSQSGGCPFLENNQCTARDGRTLGCRIFLCEMDPVQMESLHEKYFAQIQQLAKEYGVEVVYDEFISSLKKQLK